MNRREELQSLLEAKLGSKNVYFQPPESQILSYPCIVYSLDDIYKTTADNEMYRRKHRYAVTFISKSPISPLVDELMAIPYCSFSRHYKADGLNHYLYNIYY